MSSLFIFIIIINKSRFDLYQNLSQTSFYFVSNKLKILIDEYFNIIKYYNMILCDIRLLYYFNRITSL